MLKTDRVDEFVQLYSRHSRRIYGFIRALVPHQPDAEDVFQETGRVLWEKFSDFQSESNFLAWAFAISHNKVLQFRRSQARGPAQLSEETHELLDRTAWEAFGEPHQGNHRLQALETCLQKLSLADRELVDARYAPDATTQRVAEAAGRSLDAIYRSLRRIHATLFDCVRRAMRQEGLHE